MCCLSIESRRNAPGLQWTLIHGLTIYVLRCETWTADRDDYDPDRPDRITSCAHESFQIVPSLFRWNISSILLETYFIENSVYAYDKYIIPRIPHSCGFGADSWFPVQLYPPSPTARRDTAAIRGITRPRRSHTRSEYGGIIYNYPPTFQNFDWTQNIEFSNFGLTH